MKQFAKIFETAGHQLLIRFGSMNVNCPCGKPGCSGTAERPVLQIETLAEIGGIPVSLVGVLACDSSEQQARGLARFDKALAADALLMVQGMAHGAETPRQSQKRIEELKAALFA
jgi:hypothetical protein